MPWLEVAEGLRHFIWARYKLPDGQQFELTPWADGVTVKVIGDEKDRA